jgi:hypothetical protein
MSNAHQSIKRLQRELLAGLVAIVAVQVVLADPSSASVHREVPAASSSTSGAKFDIVEYIAARKIAWAQEMVDRGWLYH